MKKLLFLMVVGISFSFLSSCSLEDDDESLSNAWVGFGLVQISGDDDSVTILMDDGEVLYPVSSSAYWNELVNNQRVLTNFTILGNRQNANHDEQYYVRINSLRKILYKGIFDITPETEDSIGNDPIKVKDVWIKNNMINFELQYYGGDEIHYLNLVKQQTVTAIPYDLPIVLELRHNNRNDADHIPLSAIVTFDLTSLKIDGLNSVPIKITAKSFSGDDFEYTGVFKY